MDHVISFLAVMLILIIVCLYGRHYFDINDDVMINDIISGSITGTPDPHSVQMLSPISAIFCFIYRINASFNWYGVILCFLQYLCIALIIDKTICLFQQAGVKWILGLGEALFFSGIMASHFLFIQYSFVCGLMPATSVVLILLHQETDQNLILATLLIWIAFMLRTEMLLLLSPYICAALCFRFLADPAKKIPLLKKYCRFALITVIGLLFCLFLNAISYSSKEWKAFLQYFNARTELYDFQSIPSYKEHQDFYEQLGLQESEQALLENYNFGLDDKIDAALLSDIASYSSSQRKAASSFANTLKTSFSDYLYQLHQFSLQGAYQYPGTYFPWNILLFLLYLGNLLLFLLPKDRMQHYKMPIALSLLCVLFLGRSAIWMFLYMRGRTPIRITHPLYLIELLLLLILFLLRSKEAFSLDMASQKLYLLILPPLAAILLVACVSLPNQLTLIRAETAAREETNDHYNQLYAYFAQNPNSYYLIDVYTSLYYHEGLETSPCTYSQRIFTPRAKSVPNFDLLGGWLCKSPLSDHKIMDLGYASMKDALMGENVFLVQDSATDISWLTDYYAAIHMRITVEKYTEIAGVFSIYQILPDSSR